VALGGGRGGCGRHSIRAICQRDGECEVQKYNCVSMKCVERDGVVEMFVCNPAVEAKAVALVGYWRLLPLNRRCLSKIVNLGLATMFPRLSLQYTTDFLRDVYDVVAALDHLCTSHETGVAPTRA